VTRLTHFALLLALVACGGDGPMEVDEDPRVIRGVDLDELFAPATSAEIAAVSDDWASRSPGVEGVVEEKDTTVAVGSDLMRVRVVSHLVDGARHYGAILSAATPPGPAPVIVYAHGGDGGATVEELLFLFSYLGAPPTDFVWVIPSFRSESLGFAGSSWTSAGGASPWDRDVDDALALLEVAFDVEPSADPGSIGVLGFSRGAGVGLLMSVRDERIDRVVDFFGPTDFFDAYAQERVAAALRGDASALPGLAVLDARYLQPLIDGDLTIGEVRLEIVRRSPVLYVERLADVQVHHGTADDVVDVSQAESLIAAMESIGRGPPGFDAYLYPGGTHNPLTLPGSVARAADFLVALRPVPTR
jgi:dipeptidyl aminopeptidase/acylaminoacyl peptidase